GDRAMKQHLAKGAAQLGAALLGFVVVTTTAVAQPLGGSVMRSSANIHNSASSSLRDTQRDHWTKPFDFSDGSGPSDPALKNTRKNAGKGTVGTGSTRKPRRNFGVARNP